MCFLIGKRQFLKLLGSKNILGNISENIHTKEYSREFYVTSYKIIQWRNAEDSYLHSYC